MKKWNQSCTFNLFVNLRGISKWHQAKSLKIGHQFSANVFFSGKSALHSCLFGVFLRGRRECQICLKIYFHYLNHFVIFLRRVSFCVVVFSLFLLDQSDTKQFLSELPQGLCECCNLDVSHPHSLSGLAQIFRTYCIC